MSENSRQNNFSDVFDVFDRGDFYGRKFNVGLKDSGRASVLIPRPETEALVDEVLTLVGKPFLPGIKAPKAEILSENLRVLDVGTGSGCIAVTLALEIPEALEILAADKSEEALKVARKNAEKLGAKEVRFVRSDLLKNIDGDFDIIVANLPYVDREWEWLDLDSLAREPAEALFAEDGGCALVFELIRQAKGRTKYLILESDPCQHKRIAEFAKKHSFTLQKDQGFMQRFIA